MLYDDDFIGKNWNFISVCLEFASSTASFFTSEGDRGGGKDDCSSFNALTFGR